MALKFGECRQRLGLAIIRPEQTRRRAAAAAARCQRCNAMQYRRQPVNARDAGRAGRAGRRVVQYVRRFTLRYGLGGRLLLSYYRPLAFFPSLGQEINQGYRKANGCAVMCTGRRGVGALRLGLRVWVGIAVQ